MPVYQLDWLTSRQLRGGHLSSATPDLERQLERHLTEELGPGDTIPSERELAESFGVSRHSVRTALQRLATRGIISTHPGARSKVNAPSVAAAIAGQFLSGTRSTVDDLYDARAVIEAGAAAVLAHRVADGTFPISKLNDVTEILVQLDEQASHPSEVSSLNLAAALHRRDLDLDFHLKLVELVGSTLATGTEHSVLQPLRSYPTLWGEPKLIASWQSEHHAILDAITAGDVALAPLFVLTHLEQGRRRLTESIIGAPISRPARPGKPRHRPA